MIPYFAVRHENSSSFQILTFLIPNIPLGMLVLLFPNGDVGKQKDKLFNISPLDYS